MFSLVILKKKIDIKAYYFSHFHIFYKYWNREMGIMVWMKLLKKGNKIYLIEDVIEEKGFSSFALDSPSTYTTRFRLGTEFEYTAYLEYIPQTGMIIEVSKKKVITSYVESSRLQMILRDLNKQRDSQIKVQKNSKRRKKYLA
jgi:hypothetical protein